MLRLHFSRCTRWPQFSIGKRFFASSKPHPRETSVLVCGSEIESLVCAKIFQQAGFKTTLMFDNPPSKKDKIVVLPICLSRLLHKIYPDVYPERISPSSFEIYQHIKQDHLGNPWGLIDYHALAEEGGHSHQVLYYDALWQILYQDYRHSVGGGVFINGSVEALEHQSKKDKTHVLVTHKEKEKTIQNTYDFVVGADGPLSKVRQLLWKENEVTSEFAVRRFYTTVNGPPGAAIVHKTAEMWSRDGILSLIPISPKTFAVWGVARLDDSDEFPEDCSPKEFLKIFGHYGGPWPELIPQIEKGGRIRIEYLSDMDTVPPFFNHVALIGAAARGILPYYQGRDLGQAIEDANHLGEIMAGQATEKEMEMALAAYAEVRKFRSDWIHSAASSELQAALLPQSWWKSSITEFFLKKNNSSHRLQDQEQRLIGKENKEEKKNVALSK